MNDVYIVMVVTLVVWLGILLYLWILDRKLRSLEKELQQQQPPGARTEH
ncbi:MAG: CcmD family protein [Chloroflexia bacterium]|nr:CcmD family protein [Chloroflexia bacterium]